MTRDSSEVERDAHNVEAAGSSPAPATNAAPEFQPFQKIPRLSREITITEKIDGTNACVYIGEDGSFLTGSRSRWITPEQDNYGFAKWAQENKAALLELGPGTHYGEWWGLGIQRNYSQTRKRFSLFNVKRWGEARPACCDVVPTLYNGVMDKYEVMTGVKFALAQLRTQGSAAAPGFMKPEGIIIYHHAANMLFKKTLDRDEEWKGKQVAA